MSWASRRRFLYLAGVIAFFAIPGAVITAVWLYQAPTCFDGKMNQNETKIDRGGPCRLLDEDYLTPHSILWARTFQIRPGVQSAVAYVENPNPKAGVLEAPYRFRIYDLKNILVAEREGTIALMPGATTPIFEGDIATGDRVAVRAFFEFTAPLVWERLTDRSNLITVSDKEIARETESPTVTATVRNTDVSDMKNVAVVATVFDTAGNAFAVSSTLIPLFMAGGRMPVSFTWPRPFERQAARVDVLPVVLPLKK